MKVANSYKNYKYDETKAYEKNGKLYVSAKCKCDRCSGLGIIVARVENGKFIPVQPDSGICYKCSGEKVVRKEIRLYTDEEFAKMEKANEKARIRREEERAKKIEAEFENNRAKWLAKNKFNENEVTYTYFPADSFEVKDTLKELGFYFSPILLWHIDTIPEGYEDKVVEIKFSDVLEMSAWGEGHYILGAKDKVADIIKAARPQPTSEYIGEVGDHIKEIPVTLTLVRGFEGYYGFSQILRFEDEQGNIIKWFSAKDMSDFEIGDSMLLSGTIKKLDEDQYENGAKVTVITRGRIK